MSYSREERLELCTLLEQTGPLAPTLCSGWTTRDLAAHLVLRERRPDAAAGILGGPLAGYTARVQDRLLRGRSYTQLIDAIKSGPPRWSVFGIPGVDKRVNLGEYFVHHEDVRRAEPGWEPRDLPADMAESLWRRLPSARFLLRKVPVGIELARDDGNGDGQSFRVTVRNATPVVTVIGSPGELMMWVFGRAASARVRLEGTEPAVRTLSGASWRL